MFVLLKIEEFDCNIFCTINDNRSRRLKRNWPRELPNIKKFKI